MSLSDRRHVDAPEDLDGPDLVGEFREILDGLDLLVWRCEPDPLTRRANDLWAEIRGRSETTGPTCPHCESETWGQARGDPPVCGNGHEVGDPVVVEAIHDAWSAMLDEVEG